MEEKDVEKIRSIHDPKVKSYSNNFISFDSSIMNGFVPLSFSIFIYLMRRKIDVFFLFIFRKNVLKNFRFILGLVFSRVKV